MNSKTSAAAVIFLAFMGAASVDAHFVWLRLDPHEEQATARLFFSESGTVEGQILPEAIASAKVEYRTSNTDAEPLELSPWKAEGNAEADDDPGEETALIGHISQSNGPVCIETSCRYGMYHGSMLHYYAKAVQLGGDQQTAIASAKSFRLDLVPSTDGERLRVAVLWDGKPLSDATVTADLPGEESDTYETDASGSLVIQEASPGLYAFRVNRDDDSLGGTSDGESYSTTSYYSTLTVQLAKPASHASDGLSEDAIESDFSPLPQGVASFGAAVSDGWLYVYSGHIGKAHTHSRENLSNRFERLNLTQNGSWESLPMQTPLQGLPLVAYQGMLYRIGGLNAMNKQGDDDDLHSVDEVAKFDPASKRWTAMPPLPSPRSSHDAIVMDGKLYVVGGWNLQGDSDSEWHEEMCILDLESQDPSWKTVSAPFERRALAVSQRDGKLYIIGGMDEFDDIERAVAIYDPESNVWSDGPAIPGEGMEGFGVSAWCLNNQLFASGPGGILYRLNDAGDSWEKVADVGSRFFHRLLPLDEQQLISVGGASPKGHLASIHKLKLEP